MLLPDDARDLFDRRHAECGFAEPVLPQRAHAAGSGRRCQLVVACTIDDELGDRRGSRHKLLSTLGSSRVNRRPNRRRRVEQAWASCMKCAVPVICESSVRKRRASIGQPEECLDTQPCRDSRGRAGAPVCCRGLSNLLNPVCTPVPRFVSPSANVCGCLPTLSRMKRAYEPRIALFGLTPNFESVIVTFTLTTGGGAVVCGCAELYAAGTSATAKAVSTKRRDLTSVR